MLRLLLLPVRIVQRILWMVIWHSVYFLLKRPKLFILTSLLLLCGILYSGWAAYRNVDLLQGDTTQNVTQPPPADKALENKNIPAVTGTVENGNSAFAASLLKQMQPFEKQAYSKAFYRAMSAVPTGREHRWQANKEVYGGITPGEVFTSGSGGTCRRFTEVMSVRKANQRFTGIACRRTDNSWCRLRSNSAPVCDLKSGESWSLWWHNKKLKINDWFH